MVFTGRHDESIVQVAGETGAFGLRADNSVAEDNEKAVEICVRQDGWPSTCSSTTRRPGTTRRSGSLTSTPCAVCSTENVFGMVDLTNRVVPLMKAQERGDIVNIASTSGTKGRKLGTAYAASKWAVRGISQCWQAELRPHSIRVISICPSEVQTRWGDRVGRNNPNKLYATDISETIMAALTMHPRAMWPELSVFATNPWKED